MKKLYKVKVNDKVYEVELQEVSEQQGEIGTSSKVVENKPTSTGVTGVKVVAPMPGSVFDLKVNVGDNVSEGQVVVILEAMKMETEIVAPTSGKVESILLTKGAQVNLGDTILTIS